VIRSKFLDSLDWLLSEATRNGYKPGWAWYQLQDLFPDGLYQEEVESVAALLNYKPGWAFHQCKNLLSEGRLLYDDTPPKRPPLLVLGLTPPATESDIKRAYRRLAKRYHPDSGGDADMFRELQDAYEAALELTF